MSAVAWLYAARDVWDGMGAALAITVPIMMGGGLFRVLQSVWRDE